MAMGTEQDYMTPEDEFAAVSAELGLDDDKGAEGKAPTPEAPTAGDAEPFEGFSALPESARTKFLETFERTKTLERDLALRQRQYGALAGKVPGLERQLSEFQKRTAAAPSSAKKPELDAQAWERFKAQFPEDAKAIEQYHARQAADIAGKLTPLERQNAELVERLSRIEQQAQAAENEQIQESLAELVPDWRIIAGWETPDGNEGDRNWHPEFQAWLDSLPSRQRGYYEESLSSRDPEDAAFVMNAFKRDYIIALQDEEAAGPPAQQQVTRRQAALRDVTPTGGGGGLSERPRIPGYQSEEDLWEQVGSQFHDRWAKQG